jgi:hypothetical protein
MTRVKNWIFLIIVLVISISVPIVLIWRGVIDIEKVKELGNDFQYNLISLSSVICGFLFTGLSILTSVVDKERIKRLWDHNYLDNLHRAAVIGMIVMVITIVLPCIFLLCSINDCTQEMIVRIEIVALFIGLVELLICIYELAYLMHLMKPPKR